uniref:Uncharacterized protein n=1 Tax=Timema shepardi TaxID=629360 RepID=A0A7R9G3D8_TIMSH|nr:unnamed protein product [Timema shepardi]
MEKKKAIYRGSVHICLEGECKTTLTTPNRDSNLELPVIDCLVYCESDSLDHADIEMECAQVCGPKGLKRYNHIYTLVGRHKRESRSFKVGGVADARKGHMKLRQAAQQAGSEKYINSRTQDVGSPSHSETRRASMEEKHPRRSEPAFAWRESGKRFMKKKVRPIKIRTSICSSSAVKLITKLARYPTTPPRVMFSFHCWVGLGRRQRESDGKWTGWLAAGRMSFACICPFAFLQYPLETVQVKSVIAFYKIVYVGSIVEDGGILLNWHGHRLETVNDVFEEEHTCITPSSRHACSLKPEDPTDATTCPSLRESHEQCGNTTAPYPANSRASRKYCTKYISIQQLLAVEVFGNAFAHSDLVYDRKVDLLRVGVLLHSNRHYFSMAAPIIYFHAPSGAFQLLQYNGSAVLSPIEGHELGPGTCRPGQGRALDGPQVIAQHRQHDKNAITTRTTLLHRLLMKPQQAVWGYLSSTDI